MAFAHFYPLVVRSFFIYYVVEVVLQSFYWDWLTLSSPSFMNCHDICYIYVYNESIVLTVVRDLFIWISYGLLDCPQIEWYHLYI